MKKLLALLALVGAVGLAAPAFAQDKPSEAPAAAAPAAAAPVADKPAEAAQPKLDSGSTAWMITATILVILMTIPGLALFYGGLVRAKNMLSVLMHVFVTFCLVSVLWALYGY